MTPVIRNESTDGHGRKSPEEAMATGTRDEEEGRGLRGLRRSAGAAPRPVPALRACRTGLRTAHLLAVAVLYGGHVYGIEPERLVPALVATLASGAAFVALELYRTPLWLVQVRGVATLGKLGVLAAVPIFWEQRVALLTLVFVIGVVVSHMPGRWRSFSLLHRLPVGPEARG
jgi:hypothetical protein